MRGLAVTARAETDVRGENFLTLGWHMFVRGMLSWAVDAMVLVGNIWNFVEDV